MNLLSYHFYFSDYCSVGRTYFWIKIEISNCIFTNDVARSFVYFSPCRIFLFKAIDLLRKQLGHKSTSKLHVMLADLLAKNHDEEQAMEHYRICKPI